MKKKILAFILSLISVFQFIPVLAEDTGVYDPFNGDKDVNIVYFGGSITYADGWRVEIGKHIKEQYEGIVEGRTITNHNAAVGGTNSLYGLMRLNRDVIPLEPDMVFVEFALNDAGRPIDESVKSVEGIVRRLQSLDNPPIIVFVYTHSANMSPNNKAAYEEIAQYYNIPEIDFRERFLQMGFSEDAIDARINYYYIEDKVHPNGKGHAEWSDYAIGLMTSEPQKYFRHPLIKQNPKRTDNYSWIDADYVTAAKAYNDGIITGNGAETTGDSLFIQPGGTLSMTAGGNAFTVLANRSAKGSVLKIDVNGKNVANADSSYSGPMDMVAYSTTSLSGEEQIDFSVADTAENPFEIKGFFTSDKNKLEYPSSYPEGFIVNKWTDTSDASDEQNKNEEKTHFELLENLGLLDGCNNPSKDGIVTRAEYTCILANMFKYHDNSDSQWKNEFFSETKETGTINQDTTEDPNMFVDVSTDSIYYDYISYCKSVGLMNGMGEGYFYPNEAMTLKQSVKIILDILGYKKVLTEAGGYPNAYVYVAEDLNLKKNISAGYDDNITYKDFAQLLYNTLDVRMAEWTLDGVRAEFAKTNNTFAEKVLGLEKVSGRVVQNQYTDFSREVREKYISIDGLKLTLPEKNKKYNDYLARDVVAYYSKDDNEAVYVTLSGKDDTVVLTQDNNPSFDSNVITYEEGNKSKTKRIKNGAYVIYNGIAISSYDSSNFDITNGTITLISAKGSSVYDVVVIDNYEDWYITGIDSNNKQIYLKESRLMNAANGPITYVRRNIDFDDNEIISAVDADFNDISFNDIEIGNIVSIAANGKYIKLRYSKNIIESFTVSSVQVEDGYTIISDGNTRYKVENKYTKNEDFAELKSGNIYNLHLNTFNNVVWVDNVFVNEVFTGVLRNVVPSDENEGKVMLKISGQDEMTKNYIQAERIVYKDQNGQRKSYKDDGRLYGVISSYTGFIRYKLNDKEEVVYIERPLTDRSIQSTDGQPYDYNAIFGVGNNNEFYYTTNWSAAKMGTEYCLVNDNLKSYFDVNKFTMFYKNHNDGYDCLGSSTFMSSGIYQMHLYGTNKKIPYTEYAVCEGNSRNKKDLNQPLYIVKKVYGGLCGVDDEPGVIVEAYKVADRTVTEVKFSSIVGDATNASGMPISLFDECMDMPETGNRYNVEAGDVIYVETKDYDNEMVDKVYMIYDASDTAHKTSPEAKPGWLAGTNTVFDSTKTNNNPYIFTVNNNVQFSMLNATEAMKIRVWGIKVTLGSVVSYENNVMHLTTQDLTASNYIEGDNRYFENWIVYSDGKNASVDYSFKTPVVKALTDDDIRPYDSYGKNCSRVLVISESANIRAVIILNY